MEDEFEQMLRDKLKDKSHDELVDIIVQLETNDCSLKASIEDKLYEIRHLMVLQTFNVKY